LKNIRFYTGLLFAFLLSFALSTNSFSQSVPTSGLVAYYPFNGNANDESGNGNNGTNNGGVLTQDRQSNNNSAYYFSGAGCSPHIAATINTNNVNTSGKVTIAFWIQRKGDGCGGPRFLQFGTGEDENNPNGGHFVMGWANGEKKLFIEHSSARIQHRDYTWGNDLEDNTWYHITYTYDGSNAKLYINGDLITNRATTGTAKLNQSVSIGRFNKPAYDAFNGNMDELGVWDRVLTDDEINSLAGKVTNVSGNISTNTTWYKNNSPYVLTGNIGITASTTLTIEPGTTIKNPNDYTITILGNIIANGTSTDSIKLISGSNNNYFFVFQKTNLDNSSFSYISAKNTALSNLLNVTKFGTYPSQINNTGTLVINYSNLKYQRIITTGDNGTANLKLVNSLISDCSIKGGYPYGEPIYFTNSEIISTTIESDSYHKGMIINDGSILRSCQIRLGCCGANFDISKSYCINTQFTGGSGSPQNGPLNLSKVFLSESKIDLPSAKVNLDKCVIKNTYDSLSKGLNRIGNGNVTNSTIISRNNYAFSITGYDGYNIGGSNNYTNNLLYIPNGLFLDGFSSLSSSNNIFAKPRGFIFYNNYTSSFNSNNDFFSNISNAEIENKIFDGNDDINKGFITLTNIQNSKSVNSPITLVENVNKILTSGAVTINWSANLESDLSGYKIYYGGYNGYSYTNVIDVGNVTSYTMPSSVSIDEDIAVTAYDASKDGTDDQYEGNESWYSPANKAPDQVSISSVSPSERQVQLDWSSIPNANKYNIYKSTDSSSFTLLASTTSTSYTDQNLNTLQQRYYYKIAAFDSLDLSYTNYGLEGTHSLIKGAKPTNKPSITAVTSYTDSIKLNFSYNSNLAGITNVKIYRASETESRTLIKTLSSTATKYTDNVTSDKQYTYDVTITNATDESDVSNSSTASAFSIPVLSDKYHNKFDFAATDTLKWRKNNLATKYQFQIDTVSTFSSTALITTNPTDTFYTNSNLAKNKYLYWRVRSGDDNGYSTWSNYYISQIAQSTASIDSIYSYTGRIKIKINTGNYLGIDSIYVYRSEDGQSRNIITRLGSNATSFTDEVTNGKYYTYEIAVKNNNDISKISGVKTASGFSIPLILSPSANQFDIRPSQSFKFSKPTLSSKYVVEYDTVNTFNSSAYQTKDITDTSFTLSSLTQNQNYFCRVKGGDNNGYSSWSDIVKFQTYVKEATLDTIIAGNKKNTLKFTLPSEKGLSKIYILRDTTPSPTTIIDSSTSVISQYTDEKSLSLYKKYYYSVRLVNTDNIKSDLSVVRSGVPFNIKPTINTLTNKSYSNVGEFNTVRTIYTASGSKDPDGTIAKYQWYVNDILVNDQDSVLVYYYPHGTNNLKLIITDDDGEKDSSSATVILKSFTKKFSGGILGGITALSPNIIYAADSSYDPVNGASIYKLDRSGNTNFALAVTSKIFTTPSVSQDSSVFITSGSNLNGFNKSGAPLWPTIPLGGLSQVTPTVDSMHTRIYVGVANKNFFAIDYKTGKVVWNFQCDAPINASAVITGDRKLVFVSQAGTVYGFDIRGDSALTKATWTYTLGESIAKSAAVDDSSNLYFGTVGGKLIKLKLNRDGSITKYWTATLSSQIETSPVIDANGYVYIGTKNGKFNKINPKTGETIWEYASTGSIKATPALTDFGTIVLATTNGQIVALDTLGKVKWLHKEESPISANLLYIQNMVYVGTESGSLIALYDNPNTNTVNTSLSKNDLKKNSVHSSLASNDGSVTFIDLGLAAQKNLSAPYATVESKTPVWGTFQGNYRRTGSKALECPEKPTLNKTGTLTICNGENVELTTSALTNSTWVVDGQETTNGDGKLVAKSAGVYKRIARNDNGCKVYSEEVTIKVNEAPTKPTAIASTKTIVCEGETVQLNSSSSINNSWYKVGSTTVRGTLQGISVDTSGSYFVKVTLSNGCSSNSDTLKVTVNAKPEIPSITSASNEICSGDSLVLSVKTGFTNQWYFNGVSIKNAVAEKYTARNAGLYSVRLTNSSGCSNTSEALELIVKPTTEIPSIIPNGLPSICQGSSLLLTSSVNANNIWYKNGVKFGTGQFLNVTDSGFYKVTAMRTNMCMSQSDSLKISVNKAPTAPIITRNQTELISNYTSGNQWYSNDGTAISGATEQKFRPTTSGYYTVKATFEGCTSSNSAVYYYLSTAVVNFGNNQYIKLYPNPVQSSLFLEYNMSSTQYVNLKIMDIQGRTVKEFKKVRSGDKLNVNSLTKGAYVLLITSDNGKILVNQKMAKE
jgi:Concanavalin A-like lectin/glucanases superfamily/Secretion system C-terminal sorting domain/PQQ-like domain